MEEIQVFLIDVDGRMCEWSNNYIYEVNEGNEMKFVDILRNSVLEVYV